jgi:hypothetical protein
LLGAPLPEIGFLLRYRGLLHRRAGRGTGGGIPDAGLLCIGAGRALGCVFHSAIIAHAFQELGMDGQSGYQ